MKMKPQDPDNDKGFTQIKEDFEYIYFKDT